MKKKRVIIVPSTDTPLTTEEVLLLTLQAMESIGSTETDAG